MERLAYCLDAGEQKWRTNEHVFINVCSLCTREHFGSIANFVRFVRFGCARVCGRRHDITSRDRYRRSGRHRNRGPIRRSSGGPRHAGASGWPEGTPCDQCAIARRGHLQEPCGSCLRRRRWRKAGEGAVGAFAFGRSRGVVEGVLAAAGARSQFLTPAFWKRAVGFPPGRDKDASRAAAIQRWPARAELFARKKDDGRAEAALIAAAGLLRKGANP